MIFLSAVSHVTACNRVPKVPRDKLVETENLDRLVTLATADPRGPLVTQGGLVIRDPSVPMDQPDQKAHR